ncbi:MAG TPA: SpoIIE family protein phosphatase [Streptomyces sp.]|nr:SpoIIE family protein phosphatase [Streptomyces sp.]
MDSALAEAVRTSGASGALLYTLPPPGEDGLWLAAMTGASSDIAAPWLRIGLDDPVPVADAVREQRLVWVSGQEEMARCYPQTALVLPYDYAVAAAPVLSETRVLGGLVLLLPGAHPPQLSAAERDAVEVACRRLGDTLRQAVDLGRPLLPDGPPHIVPLPAAREGPADDAGASAFIDRLPGGSCTLGLDGRVVHLSAAAAELVGVAAADLLGKVPWEALPWMHLPEAEDSYREALVSRRPTSFAVLRPPRTWLSFSLFPDSSGISVRIVPVEAAEETPATPPRAGSGPSRLVVLSHLMHLATRLTEAVSVEDVIEQTADHLLPPLGAQAMAMMAADEGRLRVLGHRGYRDETIASLDGVPLTSEAPACRVTATGEPSFFTGPDDLLDAYPSIVHQRDKRARAFLPLIASGRPIGTLLLAYDDARLFPPGERAILTSLAGLVGQALDRARLYDANYDLARHLQSALLPHTLPLIPGLRVTARYLPAARGLGVGGDFYDLIRLGRHTAAAAIGDVQGHNVDAAALMGQVRTAVHSQANAGATPGDVLSATNRLLTDLDPGLFTSCLYADLDVSRNLAHLSTAGHPPPLLRHADGRTEVLPVPPGLLLGIEPEAQYPMAEVPLPPGCVLVLYTDGLVEVPGVDPDETLASLAEVVSAADPDGDLDAMADLLIRHAPAPGDDIALLLIHLRPDGGQDFHHTP